ncbi:MAG: hypothetical protein KKA16_07730 [Alphaproteobacteria bacterium]|nr:hypothetical protein [Alphaproteobacteria bacterium]MBU2378933.1 hypothetical protein [Alphaproteobacteria bacterium]
MSVNEPGLWAIFAIATAMALGVVRLVLWSRSLTPENRPPRWRIGMLIGLQVAAAALLGLTLFPPSDAIRSGTLIVATESAPGAIDQGLNDTLVALPEAGALQNAERAPDLATALRRHPQAARLRIVGAGLTPRDQTPLPLPVAFDPPLLPAGVVDLASPEPVAPGALFSVGGRIGALPASSVELADPSGAVIDRTRVVAGSRFGLSSSTRTPGLALFELRLRDASGALIETIAVPLETREQTPPKVLVLAGAPGAETKFLDRWAEDSGIDLSIDIDIGAGVRLGDPPVPLTRATLGELDLVVVDDRRWEALGAGARGALISAVDGGLGLLLRPTGPLSAATRRDWAGLGVALSGSGDAVAVQLDPPETPPGSDPTDAADADADPLPELARRDLTHAGPGAISIVPDADGAALASWRARGRGRVGLWTVTDSYALVLIGRDDRYGEMWSELFSALARAGSESHVRIDDFARTGERVSLCRLEGAARVAGPGGDDRPLRVDPATGERACAAYWPERDGWHSVQDGRGRETAFYVHPAGAAPSLAASRNQLATLALAASSGSDGATPASLRAPGSPWPWFVALMIVLAGLWWLERNPASGPDETARAFFSRRFRLHSG